MSFYILSPLPSTSGGTGTVVAPTAGQVPIGNANGTYTPGSITSGISGILPIANGGTALSTTPTNGQLLIGNGTTYTLSTLTAGANITITNTAGAITIASSGGGSPGGSNTEIQYNNAGTFAGSANMTFNGTGLVAATTIGVGGATPATTGSGITFPATQSTSTDVNTLDDYEEGTWTPTLIGTSTVGTATYTVQVGKYTKIGNCVTIVAEITYNSGTGTGRMRISGLPFAGSSGATNQSVGVGTDGISLTALNICNTGFIINGTSNVTPAQVPTGGGTQDSIVYDAAGSFYVFGTYFTS